MLKKEKCSSVTIFYWETNTLCLLIETKERISCFKGSSHLCLFQTDPVCECGWTGEQTEKRMDEARANRARQPSALQTEEAEGREGRKTGRRASVK